MLGLWISIQFIFPSTDEGSSKKARLEDVSGATMEEIMEAMIYGGVRKRSRKVSIISKSDIIDRGNLLAWLIFCEFYI